MLIHPTSASSKTPVIHARALSKSYREGATELRALSCVDLDIPRGQLTLLMGPSGSGKTTLLSILGCILRPTEGQLELLGEDVTALPEKELPRIRREAIGFVFQGFNLFPALTATENVELAFHVRGAGGNGARRRAEELLVEVGLDDRKHAFPADLSGGQKQRVAIAGPSPAILQFCSPMSPPPRSIPPAAAPSSNSCSVLPINTVAPWLWSLTIPASSPTAIVLCTWKMVD